MTLTKISIALSVDDADDVGDMGVIIHLGCNGGYEIYDASGQAVSPSIAIDVVDAVLMELEPIYNDLLDSPR